MCLISMSYLGEGVMEITPKRFMGKRWQSQAGMEQGMEMDVSSQSASKKQKPVNHRESAEHESNPQAASATRSCEEVFGEFQGKLMFLEDEDAPTVDEWTDV